MNYQMKQLPPRYHKSIQFDPEVYIGKTWPLINFVYKQQWNKKNQANVKMMNPITTVRFCLHLIMTSNFLVFASIASENDKSSQKVCKFNFQSIYISIQQI